MCQVVQIRSTSPQVHGGSLFSEEIMQDDARHTVFHMEGGQLRFQDEYRGWGVMSEVSIEGYTTYAKRQAALYRSLQHVTSLYSHPSHTYAGNYKQSCTGEFDDSQEDLNVQRVSRIYLYLVTNPDSRIMNLIPNVVFKLHGNRYIRRIVLTV